MELRFKNLTINLPETLGDVLFGKWLEYTKEVEGYEKLDPLSLEAQIKLFRLCEILADLPEGGLDDLMIDETADLIRYVSEIITKSADFTPRDHFTIDETTYATRKLEDMNSLTNGEYISLKTIQAQYEEDPHLFLPLAVAILIRPATLVKDAETGKEKWVLEKFSNRDIDNLTWRANLFKERALAKDIAPVINFFLSGKAVSTDNTETYSGQEPRSTNQETPS